MTLQILTIIVTVLVILTFINYIFLNNLRVATNVLVSQLKYMQKFNQDQVIINMFCVTVIRELCKINNVDPDKIIIEELNTLK